MNPPSWLQRYYGPLFTEFTPSVLVERKTKALVMLRRKKEIAYVIILKGGKHNFSTPIVLHEGLADKAKLEEMKERLIQEDP